MEPEYKERMGFKARLGLLTLYVFFLIGDWIFLSFSKSCFENNAIGGLIMIVTMFLFVITIRKIHEEGF